MKKKPIPIKFQKNERKGEAKFVASVSLKDFLARKDEQTDLDLEVKKAADQYQELVDNCRSIIDRIQKQKKILNRVSVKEMWRLGDAIHNFAGLLRKVGFCLDGLYEHLSRDLDIRRSLIEKVIIFRSYLKNPGLIPDNILWKEVWQAPRRVAVSLQKTRKRGPLRS